MVLTFSRVCFNCVITSLLLGDKYPTQSFILFVLNELTNQVDAMLPEFRATDQFYGVLTDFKSEVQDIWDALPQDTLIASLLDPRFKSLSHVKNEDERTEAWACLKSEYEKWKPQSGVTIHVFRSSYSLSLLLLLIIIIIYLFIYLNYFFIYFLLFIPSFILQSDFSRLPHLPRPRRQRFNPLLQCLQSRRHMIFSRRETNNL